MEYQARWVAFCKINNVPLNRKSTDNSDYIVWINRKWRDWLELTGTTRPLLPEHHVVFDTWLRRLAEWTAGSTNK